MAIKGLRQTEKSLPRAGIIRLGYTTRFCQNKACKYKLAYQEPDTPRCPKCGSEMSQQTPTEAPHFVLHDAPGVASALKTETPGELRVYFPFDDIEKNFPSARTLFTSSYRSCQGDGQFISHAINPTTGQTVVRDGVCVVAFSEKAADGRTTLSHQVGDKMPCPAYQEPNLYAKCAGCGNTGILLVLLEAVPTTAYFQISTHSTVNLQELPGQMLYVQEMIYSLTGQRRLSGVPFILRRILKSMTYQKKDRQGNPIGRGRVEKYVLQLEVEPQFMLDLIQAQRRLANPMAQFALPAPAQPPVPQQPAAPYDFIEPPQWESPADNGPTEATWWEEETPIAEEIEEARQVETVVSPPVEPPSFATLEDLLFQLHLEFGMKEAEAKAKLKELGFTGFPKNGEAKAKSTEMYLAVKATMAKPVQDKIPF